MRVRVVTAAPGVDPRRRRERSGRPCAGAAVGADCPGRRPRDRQRRRVRDVRIARPRVFQLHGLRTLGAAAGPHRRRGGGEGRTALLAAGRSALGEHRQLQAYALFARIRPWTGRDFDIQVGRFRRRSARSAVAPTRTTTRSSAIRWPTSTSRRFGPMRCRRAPTNCSRSGVWAGWCGTRWATRASIAASLWSARSGGTPACRSTPAPGYSARPRRSPPARFRTRCFRDDNGGRQFAGRLEVRPIAGLIAGTSFARGRFVSDAAVRSALGDGGAERRLHANRVGRRRRVFARLLPLRFESIVSAWRMPTIRTPAHRRTASRAVDVGRRTLQDRPRACTRRHASSTWDSAISSGRRRRCRGTRR